MTRHACAYCGRPLTPEAATYVGPVKFCGSAHVAEWFSLPRHDRRQVVRPVTVERRSV